MQLKRTSFLYLIIKIEIINIPLPSISAYTDHVFRTLIDLPWFENYPGYQFLPCLVNSAKGGQSAAVDAFAVADYLRKN